MTSTGPGRPRKVVLHPRVPTTGVVKKQVQLVEKERDERSVTFEPLPGMVKDLIIYNKPGTALWAVKFSGGGEAPLPLQGWFTSITGTKRAVELYASNNR